MIPLWVGWLSATWVSENTDHRLPALHYVGQQALMLAAGLATIAWLLSCLVAPMIETAKVWRDIGVKSQSAKCECGTREQQTGTSRAMGATVIPIRPLKHLARDKSI